MKKLSDEKVLETILNTRSLKEAAAELKISSRTLYTRTRTEEFRELCSAMQQSMNAQISESLFSVSLEAIKTLGEILNDSTSSTSVRVQAANTILSISERFAELNTKIQPESQILPLEEFVKKYIEPTK